MSTSASEPAAVPSLFEPERLRLEAARCLPAHCFDEFMRLARTLVHGPGFQWLLVDARSEPLRDRLMTALDGVTTGAHMETSQLALGPEIADVPAFERGLVEHAKTRDVVHVTGGSRWFDAARWNALNVRRERIAAEARARLLFWLDAESIAEASRHAPDLWAWRGGVYAFQGEAAGSGGEGVPAPHGALPPTASGIDTQTMAQRHRRIAEIRDWLASDPAPPDELLVGPLDELGRLLFEVGDYDAALAHWRRAELPFHHRRGSEREIAMTQGQIADVLQARGELDEALRIRREEQLPVYERLGDVRERAFTLGKIADVLQVRGQLEEVLRIRREEELPVYERLGDVRARAVTQGAIAEVLQARGQLEEALRIRREEELPVYERLGDVHLRALTQGRIADVLQARGQLDEALRIRREEELPVYERLGDVRERAVTQGRIADVLEARGQFDEALRIRREEELPVYARLGDVRASAITSAKIASLLMRRTPADPRTAQRLFEDAYADLHRLGLPEAGQVAEWMGSFGLTPTATDSA